MHQVTEEMWVSHSFEGNNGFTSYIQPISWTWNYNKHGMVTKVGGVIVLSIGSPRFHSQASNQAGGGKLRRKLFLSTWCGLITVIHVDEVKYTTDGPHV